MSQLPSPKALRRQAFRMPQPLSQPLLSMAQGHATHRFLLNPAGQNVYLYLTHYIRTFAEAWFDRPFSTVKVLDWGCGKGQVSYLLREMGAVLTSCDVVSAAEDSTFGQATPIIEQAQLPVVPLEHDYLLPFADDSFDVVLSVGVLEHVPNDRASLTELHRILRPRGLLFCFNLPYYLSWTQRLAHLRGNYYHDRLYRKDQVHAYLTAAGYDLIEIWHRQLLPKNSVPYPDHHLFERIDQWLTEHTPLRYLATNIEFVACKLP